MKTQKIVIWCLRILMAAAVVLKLVLGQYGLAAYGTVAVALTFLPELARLLFHWEIPMEFRTILTVFVFLAMTVAKLFYLYEITNWWDKFLHCCSGVILAYVGVTIGRRLTRGENRLIILLFGLAFAIACAAVWEIWEFSGDALFGLDSQRRATGVVDTMGDIIAGTIGACVTIPFLKKIADGKQNPDA